MAIKITIDTPKKTLGLAAQLEAVQSKAVNPLAISNEQSKPKPKLNLNLGMDNDLVISTAGRPNNNAQMPTTTTTPNSIPKVTAEKYALIADASDTLSQSTINEFNLRMNFIVQSMDNEDLPDAMKRVLEYTQLHNELQPWLRAEDIAVFVRGARSSYAAVAVKKGSSRTKRTKSSAINDQIMSDLMDLEITI